MSTRRNRLVSLFAGSRETQTQQQQAPVPSPSTTPRPVRIPELPIEERILSSDDLQQSVEALEMVLKTMDQVRDQTNRYNSSLREHARSLRGYAVGINMGGPREARAVNVGEERVYEKLLEHCANYYDRLAESQEHLARMYLEEYNILNNHSAKYFKTLARDSSKLDNNLKDLTRKLSKLTHKSAAPGSANTQNASTVQNVGVHENYVHRLTGLSGQIQNVRHDHLVLYTRKQRQMDRVVGQSFARCARQNYGFLADAIYKTGTTEAIGGVNAWGAFAIAGVQPPINDIDAETEVQGDDDWEGSDDGEEPMSPRQIAQQHDPRPPSSMMSLMSEARGDPRGYSNLNVQGRIPQQSSQTFQPSVCPLFLLIQVLSPQPRRSTQALQYAPINPESNGQQGPSSIGVTQGVSVGQGRNSTFRENFTATP